MNLTPLILLLATLAAPAPAADPPAPKSDPASLRAAARAALADGNPDRALTLSAAAIHAAPSEPAGYALRAAAHDARRDFAAALTDYDKLLSLSPDNVAALHHRGEAHFRLGHFKQSVADFDQEIVLDPAREPHHWQRGLSLYYAADYARAAKQFELHRTVNPDDVENAAWHYLCTARLSGIEKARAALLPVGPDARVPMKEIYDLYAGTLTPEAVLRVTEAPDPTPREQKSRRFYAHLYVGLWYEAQCGAGVPPAAADPKAGETPAPQKAGETPAPQKAGGTPAPQLLAKAQEHIRHAAEQYADNDYMGDVARVHAATLKPKPR